MNLIFDFDGTICQSGAMTYIHLKEMCPDLPEWEELRKTPSDQVVKLLGLGPLKLIWTLYRGRRVFSAHLEGVPLVDGVRPAFESLSRDHRLFICSSNSSKNIHRYLVRHQILEHFESILSVPSVFGKKRYLKRWIKKNRFCIEDCIYFGDETRDLQAAHGLNMKVCAVGWGFHHPELLADYQPTFLVHHPEELSGLI